jgi:hypothetical protein
MPASTPVDEQQWVVKRDSSDANPVVRCRRSPSSLDLKLPVSTKHVAEFYALFGGGVRDPGWEGPPRFTRARLAIVPGYTHYNFVNGPDVARIIEAYLSKPTSSASPVNS